MTEKRLYIVEDELGDAHSFVGSVGDALIAAGVIRRGPGGKWVIARKDTNIVEEKRMDLATCDFCSTRPVTFSVEAEDFEDAFGNISIGGWAACEECGKLIEANEREKLLARLLALHATLFGEVFITHNQQLFWKAFKSIERITPRVFGN